MKCKCILPVIAALTLLACSTAPEVVEGAGQFSGHGKRSVFITNRGWHTGIVIPASPIQQRLPELEERFAEAAYMEFGWGDRKFYQAEAMTSGLAVQAVFWPTATVVLATGVPQNLNRFFTSAGVVKLCLDEAQLASLVNFLANSFDKNDEGSIKAVGVAGRRSQFYAGTGRYHMTNTCNTWTAKGLKSAGMEISTAFRLTAGSVMDYLHQQPEAQTLLRRGQVEQVEDPDFSCP